MSPPKKETEIIQTHKHMYRAKQRRLQKSNMQVLKDSKSSLRKKTCREVTAERHFSQISFEIF
jgi:hypothetical protein